MPRKPKSNGTAQTPHEIDRGVFYCPSDANWGGFINVRLSDDDKSVFESWRDQNHGETARMLDDLLGQGMKVSFSYDHENDCYICSFMGRLTSVSKDRLCTVTRAGSLAEVIDLSVWKHYVVAGGDYGDFMPRSGTFAHWG